MNKFFIIFLLFIACKQKQKNKLTIATAANMQFIIHELVNSFTKETGIECEVIVGSSGKLTAQIKEGAPFDVFVSADMKYPNKLFKNGLTTKTPTIYAYGKLVLWTMFDNLKPSLNLLLSDSINHIALANPKVAPYGLSTIEVLNHTKMFKKVKDKLVYGESISQTNQFITSKVAEIGFTAKSVVLSPNIKGKGTWVDIDSSYYSLIEQGIVILKNRPSQINNAQKFYNFLLSAKAKEILNKFGYSTK
ncbi:MAG: molybdate ABC transporter substrate-binding protein [Flavobacteriaceae bacterium]|nr:molybdate ABC transporter substrate-binding protein [Flavobacteriaceae bacterium]